MKKILFLLFSLFAFSAFGQVVYLGGYTSTQINGISPGSGYPILYNTTVSEFQRWNGTTWEPWGGGAADIVDPLSPRRPMIWGPGTKAEYYADYPFGSNVPANLLAFVTDSAQIASRIVNIPSGNLTATDVQAALNELQAELDAGTGTDDQTAAEVPVADTGGNYTATDVEGVLAEIAPQLGGGGGSSDAIDITVTPAGNLGSTNVQAGLQELQGDIDILNSTPSFTALTTYDDISALPAVTGSEADLYCVVTDDPSGANGLYGIVSGAWKYLYSKFDKDAPFVRTSVNWIDVDDPDYQAGTRFANANDGTTVADALKYLSGFIPVSLGDKFYANGNFTRYAFYDANKDYITGSASYILIDEPKVELPEARFMRIDGDLADIGSQDQVVRAYDHDAGGVPSGWTDFDAGYARDNENFIYEAEGVIIPKLSTNLYDYKNGDYTGSVTSAGSASGLPSTGYIPVTPGYQYNCNYPTNASIAFFDAEKTYISGSISTEATAPATARYVMFTIPSNNPPVNFENYQVTQGQRNVQISDVRTSTLENVFTEPVDVCLIGDSIGTESDVYASAVAYGGVMADLLKYENYINMSVSGMTMSQVAGQTNGWSGKVPPPADLFIIALGTNDWGFFVPLGDSADTWPADSTFWAALDGVRDQLLAINPDAVLAFITPLTRKGGDFPSGAGSSNLKEYVDAVLAFSRENQYPVLDLYTETSFNPEDTTMFNNWTDSANDGGPDGIHPTDEGHKIYIYPHIASWIKTQIERAK